MLKQEGKFGEKQQQKICINLTNSWHLIYVSAGKKKNFTFIFPSLFFVSCNFTIYHIRANQKFDAGTINKLEIIEKVH